MEQFFQILGCSHEDRMVGIFYRKIYETFVEAIDAVDNGIPQYDGTPRYVESFIDLHSFLQCFLQISHVWWTLWTCW